MLAQIVVANLQHRGFTDSLWVDTLAFCFGLQILGKEKTNQNNLIKFPFSETRSSTWARAICPTRYTASNSSWSSSISSETRTNRPSKQTMKLQSPWSYSFRVLSFWQLKYTAQSALLLFFYSLILLSWLAMLSRGFSDKRESKSKCESNCEN